MTAQERDTLNRLEYNLKRLMELVVTQSQVLQQQQRSLGLLRAENVQLREQLSQEQAQSHLRQVAQGLANNDPEGKTLALSYLAEIIEDVRLSIRQLEQE